MKEKIVENGIVYEIEDYTEKVEIGKIAKVELTIEHPEQMLGSSRVESSILFDEQDKELMNDQDVVDNQEYHSDEDLINSIARRYNISKDLIESI